MTIIRSLQEKTVFEDHKYIPNVISNKHEIVWGGDFMARVGQQTYNGVVKK